MATLDAVGEVVHRDVGDQGGRVVELGLQTVGDWRVSRAQARERLNEGRHILFVPINNDERIVVADVEKIVNVDSRVNGLDLLRVRIAVLTPAMGERRQGVGS